MMNFSIVLYLCSIFGTSLGFWKIYSKDQKKKTRNASGYKVVLLLLCFLLSWFFYIKTYQVATLKNIVVVEGKKGSFDETGKERKDTISNITFFSKFVDEKWQEGIYISDMSPDLNSSGMLMFVKLNNDSGVHQYYFDEGRALAYATNDSLKHMYNVSFAATSIPSLFPFSSATSQSFVSSDSLFVSVVSNKQAIDDIEKIMYGASDDKMPSWVTNNSTNWGTCSSSLFYSYEKNNSKEDDYWFKTITADSKINNISIFSLADLSQCDFEFQFKTDIPLKSFTLFLDVPADFSSLDIVRDKVTYNGFTLDSLESLNEHGGGVFRVHAKLPTQENLQLIRSLVLTSIVTALFTMLLSNIYYYSRKWLRENQHRNTRQSVWRRKLEIRYLWYIMGQRLALFSFVLFAAWLIMLELNLIVSIPESKTGLVISLSILAIVLIVFSIIAITYFGYRQFIKSRYQRLINAETQLITKPKQRKPRHKAKKRAKTQNNTTKENDNKQNRRQSPKNNQSNIEAYEEL